MLLVELVLGIWQAYLLLTKYFNPLAGGRDIASQLKLKDATRSAVGLGGRLGLVDGPLGW